MKNTPSKTIGQRPANKRGGRESQFDWDSVNWKANRFDSTAVAKRLGCAVVTVNARWRKVNGRIRNVSVLKDWKDWSLPVRQIAERAGVSRQRVEAYKKRLFPPIGQA